jgi:hypothetical protein
MKTQGEPEPQTLERQQKRLEGGVNVKKPIGGTRVPAETKARVGETEVQEAEAQQAGVASLRQEIPQHPEKVTPSAEYKGASSTKTGGNYDPHGYRTVMIGKGKARAFKIKENDKGEITSFINPLSQIEVTVVKVPLSDGIAGYSKDGERIYIDPEVPSWMYLPLITHETFEMLLVETLGFNYEWAHTQATRAERQTCKNLDMDWDKYDGEFHRVLNIVEKREPRAKGPKDIRISFGSGTKKGGKGSEGTAAPIRKETGDKEVGQAGQERMGMPPAVRHDTRYTQGGE